MENVFLVHNMTNPHLFRCSLVGHSLFMGVFFPDIDVFLTQFCEWEAFNPKPFPTPSQEFSSVQNTTKHGQIKIAKHIRLSYCWYILGEKRTKYCFKIVFLYNDAIHLSFPPMSSSWKNRSFESDLFGETVRNDSFSNWTESVSSQ